MKLFNRAFRESCHALDMGWTLKWCLCKRTWLVEVTSFDDARRTWMCTECGGQVKR